jgi:hypothetical protein
LETAATMAVEGLGFGGKVLVLADQPREPIDAGCKARPELVDGGGRRRLDKSRFPPLHGGRVISSTSSAAADPTEVSDTRERLVRRA